jgi:L-asparaginase II
MVSYAADEVNRLISHLACERLYVAEEELSEAVKEKCMNGGMLAMTGAEGTE